MMRDGRRCGRELQVGVDTMWVRQKVHVRDIRTIIEALAEHATATTDPVELARRVRMALVAQTAECLEAAHRIAAFVRGTPKAPT